MTPRASSLTEVDLVDFRELSSYSKQLIQIFVKHNCTEVIVYQLMKQYCAEVVGAEHIVWNMLLQQCCIPGIVVATMC